MNHWVWDDDPDESLCGKEVSWSTWNEAEVDCHNCLKVDAFLKLVENFNATFDVKDSLYAAIGIWNKWTAKV